MGKTGNQYPPTSWMREARFRRAPLAPLPYDGGLRQVNNRDLRNTGYQERIRIVQRITATNSVAPTSLDFFAQFAGGIDRFILRTQGSGLLYDVSGEGLGLISFFDNLYRRDGGQSLQPPGSYTLSAAPGTAATSLVLTHDVPIALNVANYYSPVGLFQNAVLPTELSAQIYMRPLAALTGPPGSGVWVVAANVPTGVSGNFFMEQEYYETIPNPNGWPVGNKLVTWREITTPVSADGVVAINLQPNKKVTMLIHWLITGATAAALTGDSSHATNLALKFGGSNVIYDETIDMVNSRQARIYNTALPAGVYVQDMSTETHTDRDWFDTSQVPNPRAELTVSGASYAGGAYVKTVIREVSDVIPAGGAIRN
jgi:hypothetical protein